MRDIRDNTAVGSKDSGQLNMATTTCELPAAQRRRLSDGRGLCTCY